MTYSLTGMHLLVLLLVVLLPTLLLCLILAWAVIHLQRSSQKVILNLLDNQTLENQSLRNQLRAADVSSLVALQQTTAVPQSSLSEEQYIPTYDEGIQYQEALSAGDLEQQGMSDDLNARGWDAVVTTDRGGPVKFE